MIFKNTHAEIMSSVTATQIWIRIQILYYPDGNSVVVNMWH